KSYTAFACGHCLWLTTDGGAITAPIVVCVKLVCAAVERRRHGDEKNGASPGQKLWSSFSSLSRSSALPPAASVSSPESVKGEEGHVRVQYYLADSVRTCRLQVLCRFLLELHNSLDLFEAEDCIIPSTGSSFLSVAAGAIDTSSYMLEEILRPLTMALPVDDLHDAGELEPADGLHDVVNAISKVDEDRATITHLTEAGTLRGKRGAILIIVQ
ncbi:hypothetical protein POSPLADRAFT_1145194, partial [Postia placenta MAD-698-R-SB12]